MKRISIRTGLISLILFGGLFAILGFGTVRAQSFHTGDNVIFSKDKKIDQTVYAAGRNIDIASEISGDLFCGGQTVTISGTVHGDVICAGQTLNVTGKVDGDVRLAGQTVNLDGMVNGNASIGGQTFNLGSKAKIMGDASIGSSASALNGTIGRDLAVGSESITVNNLIGRDIKASVGKIELTDQAQVKGSIDYTSSNELIKSSGAQIGGKVSQTLPKQESRPKNGAAFGMVLGWIIYLLVALSIVSMTLALLYPALLPRVTNRAFPRPFKAFFTGFIFNLVAPAIIGLTAITVIGVPLAVILAIGWILVLSLSGPFAGYYLGRLVLRGNQNVPAIMFGGGTLLLLTYFIPFIGMIALIFAASIGTGMILLELEASTPRPVYNIDSKPKKK